MLYIGNVAIKRTAALAPMAGISDIVYRKLCCEMKAAYTVSEMVSAKAICYKNKNTLSLLKLAQNNVPTAIQLFGYEPNIMMQAALYVAEFVNPDIIDINMGCPVPKIAENFSGCSLMNEPKLAGEIVEAVVKNVDVPVTVKIRKGWDNKNVNAVHLAKVVQESGAKAITVHGRTREDMYKGTVDLDVIRQVKQSIDIPVIGNGDIVNCEDAKKMYDETGCDLVMVGRGSLGRPWIFEQIEQFLVNGVNLKEPSWESKSKIILEHGMRMCDEYGECYGMQQMRKHFIWYTRGLRGGAKLREKVGNIDSFKSLEKFVCEFLKKVA